MMRIEEFLDALASGAPVPGGGGASALGGALGSALGQMVANLTVGKKKYACWEGEIRELLGQLGRLQRRFLELAREDEEVFAPWQRPTACPRPRRRREPLRSRSWKNACWTPAWCPWRS